MEVASVVERARQRKEEEEKRYQESTRQAAAKKLQDLEQKMKEKQANESKCLISVPAVAIPVPEWEREKENRDRERSDGKEEKPLNRESREARDGPKDCRDSRDQLMPDIRQGDRQAFSRQDSIRNERERERDRDRDQRDTRDRELHATFSRHFQNNLPPRFQKQQAERSSAAFNRISPSAADRSPAQPVPFSQQYDPGRWVHSHSSLSKCSLKLHFIRT